MGIKFSNNASTYLASTLNDSATSLTVQAGTGNRFPSLSTGDYFLCTLQNTDGSLEIVKVTARNVDVFTIVRAQEGTTAKSFFSGALVEQRMTAASMTWYQAEVISDAEATATAISTAVTTDILEDYTEAAAASALAAAASAVEAAGSADNSEQYMLDAQAAAVAAQIIAPPWDASTSYIFPQVVTGSNLNTYRARIPSTGVDPVTDNDTHWALMVSQFPSINGKTGQSLTVFGTTMQWMPTVGSTVFQHMIAGGF